MGAEKLFRAIEKSERLNPKNLPTLVAKRDTDSLWEMYEQYQQFGNLDLIMDILFCLIELGENDAYQNLLQLAEINMQVNPEITLTIIDHIFCKHDLPENIFPVPQKILTATKTLQKQFLAFAHETDNPLLEVELLMRINNNLGKVSEKIRILIETALARCQYAIGGNEITYAMEEIGMPQERIDEVKNLIDVEFGIEVKE